MGHDFASDGVSEPFDMTIAEDLTAKCKGSRTECARVACVALERALQHSDYCMPCQ